MGGVQRAEAVARAAGPILVDLRRVRSGTSTAAIKQWCMLQGRAQQGAQSCSARTAITVADSARTDPRASSRRDCQ